MIFREVSLINKIFKKFPIGLSNFTQKVPYSSLLLKGVGMSTVGNVKINKNESTNTLRQSQIHYWGWLGEGSDMEMRLAQ